MLIEKGIKTAKNRKIKKYNTMLTCRSEAEVSVEHLVMYGFGG